MLPDPLLSALSLLLLGGNTVKMLQKMCWVPLVGAFGCDRQNSHEHFSVAISTPSDGRTFCTLGATSFSKSWGGHAMLLELVTCHALQQALFVRHHKKCSAFCLDTLSTLCLNHAHQNNLQESQSRFMSAKKKESDAAHHSNGTGLAGKKNGICCLERWQRLLLRFSLALNGPFIADHGVGFQLCSWAWML